MRYAMLICADEKWMASLDDDGGVGDAGRVRRSGWTR